MLPKLNISDLIKSTRRQPVLVDKLDSKEKSFKQYHIKTEEDINFYRLVFNFKAVDQDFLKKIMLWIYSMNSTVSTKSNSYR